MSSSASSAGTRVLHLDTGKAFRGGQRQILLLHRELVRRGWASLVAAPDSSELAARCGAERLPMLGLTSRRGWHPVVLARIVANARRAAIVHAHDPHAAGIAAAARAFGATARIVCHRRVAFPLRARPGGLKFRAVDHWIAVTGDIAGGLRTWGLSADRCTVIPSAIDVDALRHAAAAEVPGALRAALGLAAEGSLVVACAAFEPDKGLDVLVRAMAEVRARVPGAICAIAGDGPERCGLEHLIDELGLAGAVTLVGQLGEVAGLVAAADVCVVPSRHREGSAAALKEPLALDRPLVASDLPATREVVGDAGRLTRPGDPEELAVAIVEVLHDSELRARLVAQGRRRVELFRPDTMAGRTLEVYEGLLAGAM